VGCKDDVWEGVSRIGRREQCGSVGVGLLFGFFVSLLFFLLVGFDPMVWGCVSFH
jgi:hypothetical protein